MSGHSSWLQLEGQQRGECNKGSRIFRKPRLRFPLPAGEGQGEGERDDANQNGRTNFTSAARPGDRRLLRCPLPAEGAEREPFALSFVLFLHSTAVGKGPVRNQNLVISRGPN